MANRKMIVTIGGQRAGKSFKANEDIKRFIKTGQSAFVYNLGKPDDFESCTYVELLTIEEHQEYIYDTFGKEEYKKFKSFPKFKYFRCPDKATRLNKEGVFDIKEFSSIFYGQGAKATGLDEKSETLFFMAYFRYVSNCMLVFDDSTNTFNSNLKGWQKAILTRLNHTGRDHIGGANYQGAGSEGILMFHSLNQIPQRVLDNVQDDWIFRTFKYNEPPDFKRIKNYNIRKSLKASFLALQSLPLYSYSEYYQQEDKTVIFTFNKGKYKKQFITFK